jgi:hypothetical protein
MTRSEASCCAVSCSRRRPPPGAPNEGNLGLESKTEIPATALRARPWMSVSAERDMCAGVTVARAHDCGHGGNDGGHQVLDGRSSW